MYTFKHEKKIVGNFCASQPCHQIHYIGLCCGMWQCEPTPPQFPTDSAWGNGGMGDASACLLGAYKCSGFPLPPLSPENKEKEEDHSLTLRSCRQSLSEEEEGGLTGRKSTIPK